MTDDWKEEEERGRGAPSTPTSDFVKERNGKRSDLDGKRERESGE